MTSTIKPRPTLSAIDVEVIWNRLISIAAESESALVRTSFSTVISEARDFASIVLDAHGRSIAQAVGTLPAFTLALPFTVTHYREVHGLEGLNEGDVIATNDPWHGTGHLSDISILRPVFRRGQVIGFAAATGHVSDIGGVVSYHSGRDVFEEGFQIPFLKIFERGVPNHQFFDLLAANVRVPDLVIGDVEAMVAATRVTEARLQALLDDTGLPDLEAISFEIGARASAAMREAISAIPDGVYEGEYEFDGYSEPLAIRTSVEIAGDSARVDFAGTAPQQDVGAINAPFVISRAEVLYFFQYVLTPEVPPCSALFDPISITAPDGTIVSPVRPAAVKARSKTTFHIPEALFRAMAPVLGDRVQAASGHSCYVILNGLREDGRPFNSFYLPGGGMGAAEGHDGLDCTLYPTNTTVTPIEIFEATAPVVVERKVLLTDSGGPGAWRGGAGQQVVIQSVSDRPLTVTLRPEDKVRPPTGLSNGGPGSVCRVYVQGERTDADLIVLQPGERLVVETPGGGGFGDPSERAAEAVIEDVESGLVSKSAAEQVYRVVPSLLAAAPQEVGS